jgi:hypothetical protein
MPRKERIAGVDGKIAYWLAIKNLQSILICPQFMMETYPEKFFLCRDSRRGLLLPGKLVYFSKSSGEGEIKAIKGGKMTVKDGLASVSYVFTRTSNIKKEIPSKAIADVIRFTKEVKAKMSQLTEAEVLK